MSLAQERISELEEEIIQAANLKSQLIASRTLCRTEPSKKIIAEQLQMISKRIGRAQAEISLIERDYFAELAVERRDKKYPPIDLVMKSKIRFAGGAEVGR